MANIMKYTEKIYIIVLFVNLILNCILPYNIYVSDVIKDGISIVLMLTGGAILLFNFITNKEKIFKNNAIILYIFLGVYIISSITMIGYGVIDNIKTIIWTFIIFGVIYNLCNDLKKEEITKGGKVLYYILTAIWNVALIYSLYQFVNGIGYTIKYEEFVINKAQGFFYNRLFGIFVDPNYAAATSVIFMFVSLFMFWTTKNKALKVYDLLIVVLQLLYIILSGSRTGLVMLFVGSVVALFLVFRNKLYKRGDKLVYIKTIICTLLSLSIVVLIVWGVKEFSPYLVNKANLNSKVMLVKVLTRKEGKFTSSYMEVVKEDGSSVDEVATKKDEDVATKPQTNGKPSKTQNTSTSQQTTSNTQTQTNTLSMPKPQEDSNKVSFDRLDLEEKEDSSNLRFELWADSLEIASSRCFFGVSPRNLIKYAKENYPDTLPAKGYDCGSGFVSIVVYTGLVGTVVIGIFIILTICKLIKYIFNTIYVDGLNILLAVIIFVVGADAVLNQEIFFINSINTGIFWLSLGLLRTRISYKEKVNKQKGKDKVGIVTIHDADNYGSDLQAYATQKAIENLGYDAYIIDHKCKKIASEYGIKRIFVQKSIKAIIETIVRIITIFPARVKFTEFREDFYKLAPKDVNQNDYKKFVVGSDQVWNNKITGMDRDYFLDFVKDNNKKIAFSSSFGITEVPEELKEEYTSLLSSFKDIAVREEQGVKIIKDLTGKTVPVVLDPTLLLSKEDWYDVMNMPYRQRGYILCYQIAHSPSLVKFAEELAEKTGKKIISIQGSLRQRFNAKYIWNAGPAEYVGLIKNADYVVTNSFHGTAFSINLNKNFFTEMLPSFEKTSSRLENILDTFELRSRQIVDGKNENMLTDIDYEKVNKKLEEEKERSIDILKGFLEKE